MKHSQRGATIIEFALVFLLFLMFMLAILDFSRMLFTWNAASEATRIGARHAAVCDSTREASEVRDRMRAMLPQIDRVSIEWDPPSCSSGNCVGVRVGITDLNYQWISPLAGLVGALDLPMPSFSTYLTREAMRQDPLSDSVLCRPSDAS